MMFGQKIKLYPRQIICRFPRPKYDQSFKRVPYPKKPTKRSECKYGLRPCPFISCRYHLYMDIVSGKMKHHFLADPCLMNETCALDLAERKRGMNLDDISNYFGLTRERIRQIIEDALRKIRSQKTNSDRYKSD